MTLLNQINTINGRFARNFYTTPGPVSSPIALFFRRARGPAVSGTPCPAPGALNTIGIGPEARRCIVGLLPTPCALNTVMLSFPGRLGEASLPTEPATL